MKFISVNTLKTLLYPKDLCYDGTQLSSHWIYRTFDLAGDALVAFQGKAQVTTDHMVDLEDVKNNAPIYSPRMLHFVGEWFREGLDIAILYQNLLVRNAYEILLQKSLVGLSRKGNDLFFQNRKLSVSIATCSAVSLLIHLGINIRTDGTPVPTAGLNELEISPMEFADELLERFSQDFEGWRRARAKVQPR
ncbi:MAG: DUF366 family protein [Deltaproteobacteria bacterium]|nr:DUF366 family protein [Deltaproteobacteria bacterium]